MEGKDDLAKVYPKDEIYEGFKIKALKPKAVAKIIGLIQSSAKKKTSKDEVFNPVELLATNYEDVKDILTEICEVNSEKFETTDIDVVLEVIARIIERNEKVLSSFFVAMERIVKAVTKAVSVK